MVVKYGVHAQVCSSLLLRFYQPPDIGNMEELLADSWTAKLVAVARAVYNRCRGRGAGYARVGSRDSEMCSLV